MDNKQLLIFAGVFVIGAGAGFGGGYLVFKKKYQKLADAEIESVRLAYSKAATPKPDLQDVKAEYDRILAEQRYVPTTEEAGNDADSFLAENGRVPTLDELVAMGQADAEARRKEDHDDAHLVEGNIFDNPQPDEETLGVEEVRTERDATHPYVIESHEWYLNESDYDQVTLTYWADDGVLADDAYRLVNEVEAVVGETNLHRFGFKSDHPDIVYIRNERLGADYEITKDERNYAEVVHGIPPESLNNSASARRMRSNDE